MQAPKLIGITASAALSISMALAVNAPAGAQSGGGGSAAAVEARVPQPDLLELAPLTPADLQPSSEAATATPAPQPSTEAAIPGTPPGNQPPAAAARVERTGPAERAGTGRDPSLSPQDVAPAAAAIGDSVRPAGEPKVEAEAPASPAPAPAATANVEPTPPVTRSEPNAPSTVAQPSSGSPTTVAAPEKAPAAPVDIQAAIPVPEAAGVPPLTMKDIGVPALNPADLAIAERLKEMVAGRLDRFLDRKPEREAVKEFYEERNFAPVWFDAGAPKPRMTAAIRRLKAADADGLDAADYAMPDVKELGADAAARAEAELRLTSAVLTYARHAQSGRTVPTRISTNIEFSPPVPDAAEVLKTLVKAEDIAKALDAFNPPHAGFQALRRKLAELRGDTADDKVVQIPPGPMMRLGSDDERVPLLRKRLGVTTTPEDELVFGPELSAALKAFQKEKGLSQDGMLGPRTLDALNGRSPSRDIATVISNMERWRWLPRELGNAYVMVNVPDFTLKVVRGQRTAFTTKIVVGKPETPTPSFAAVIETIQVNPTWHVPQSIIYGEYLPALQKDPTVLARMGLVMDRNRDGSISIRQPPGERNALGRIKFNFPNRFQVYLHDTPDKKLFAHERRSYSHGCMRVQDPTKFGEVLASIALPGENYTSERFQGMFGSGERWIKFSKKIPVYLVYMNAYVDDAGQLVVRPDLYGYDNRVQSALRGQYMVVSERSQRVSPQAVRRARQIVQEVPRERRGGFFLFPWFQ